jgi:soluble lytic murein transglycosylase-like protein
LFVEAQSLRHRLARFGVAAGCALVVGVSSLSCAREVPVRTDPYLSEPDIRYAVDLVVGRRIPDAGRIIRGDRLLADAPAPAPRAVAVVRSIVRSNLRIRPLDALHLAHLAIAAANAYGIDPDIFCSLLLQESGFDTQIVSGAGAIGIAQFEPETAARYGIDPRDPASALPGAARLLAEYLADYTGRYDDPVAAALAAYNAGPGAVARYGGVPPYPETVEYVSDIYDRRARILRDRTRRMRGYVERPFF